MGNSERRRKWRLDSEHAADWARIRTESRAAREDICAFGIGARRLQLVVCPAFGQSRAWEVRQLEDEWRLYESEPPAQWQPLVNLAIEMGSIFADLARDKS